MQDSIRISDKEKHNLNFLPSDPGIYRFLDNNKKVDGLTFDSSL